MNDFSEIYKRQEQFQRKIIHKGQNEPVISDDVKWFSYHCLAIVEEIGEVLKADKRWKTHRNHRYEKREKIDEIADIFITAMNISIFSGLDSEEIFNAISRKIDENFSRIESKEVKDDKRSDC